MINIAYVAIFFGAAALLIDLGNRVFGSYTRSLVGTSARIILLVVVLLLYLFPLAWKMSAPASPASQSLFYLSAGLGFMVMVHFLFPYRWGICRLTLNRPLSIQPLATGIDLVDEVIEIADLPTAAEGTTCLILSDIHCNNKKILAQLKKAIDNLQQAGTDFVFLLGDFGEKDSLLPQVIDEISRLKGRFGTFCVLGNHDCEGGREKLLAELLKQSDIRLLRDEIHLISELQMTLLGISYPWTGKPLPQQAPNGFVIALTHTPDNIVHFQRWNVHLGFAGHTYGGKLRLPLLGAVLIPTWLGRFLDRGWFRLGSAIMVVTRGIGYFPGRFGNSRFANNGQIIRLTLKSLKPITAC